MGYKSGYKFRLRINSTAYGCSDVGVDASVDPQDVSNSEGYTGQSGITAHVGYSSVISGLRSARANFRGATFADDENPFTAPWNAIPGEYATLRVYLWGLTGVSWYFPSFLIVGTSWNAQVRGLQPVSVNGQSDGLYYLPDGTG